MKDNVAMNEATTVAGTQTEESRERPSLICRLRPKVVIGRRGPIPNMGEVELENASSSPLEIEYSMTPLQFFDLEVTGPDGRVVSEGHFSDRFSPSLEPSVLRLLPGEKFTAHVALLATMPPEKRQPGKYTVQASYRFQGVRIMAEPLMVEITGD
jgi:hypothetical protein